MCLVWICLVLFVRPLKDVNQRLGKPWQSFDVMQQCVETN